MPDMTDRGPDSFQASHPLLISFEIDCGTLVAGHRVSLTGLSDHGFSRSDLAGGEHEVACQMVSLEYDLLPGVRIEEAADGFDERFILQAAYHADVDLPWSTAGVGGLGPKEIEFFAGGDRTHGALGPWPVPAGAGTLTFVLHRPPTSYHDAVDRVAGKVVIDLAAGVAEWIPA
jgi:hypothetical protein